MTTFTHLRPSSGGGFRPAHCRASPRVCGLLEFSAAAARAREPMKVPAPQQAAAPLAVRAPWMETAIGEIGIAEYRGLHKANPRIMEYFKASGFWGDDDSGGKNAWCGSFVAWVLKRHNIPPVRHAFRAREWANFGKRLDAPVYGAIGIKERKGGGHVAFMMGRSDDGEQYFMLGGNQRDKVQVMAYPKRAWTTFVVPHDYDVNRSDLPVYDGPSVPAGQES